MNTFCRTLSAGFTENNKDLIGWTFLEPHRDSHDRNKQNYDDQDGYQNASGNKCAVSEKKIRTHKTDLLCFVLFFFGIL